MAIEIKGVDGAEQSAALSRLRYDVYVREFGRRLPGCDDDQGLLVEQEDGVSTHFVAFDGGDPVACLRLTPIDALDAGSRWRANYEISAFPVAEPKQAVLSRLVVREDHRGSLLAPQLLAAAYDAFRAADGELLYLRCAANVVSLYEVMGFRRYRAGNVDGEGGYGSCEEARKEAMTQGEAYAKGLAPEAGNGNGSAPPGSGDELFIPPSAQAQRPQPAAN